MRKHVKLCLMEVPSPCLQDLPIEELRQGRFCMSKLVVGRICTKLIIKVIPGFILIQLCKLGSHNLN